MSSFSTRLPVDVESVKALLPKGSDLEGIVWDGAGVTVIWSHQKLVTPFTVNTEVSIDDLKSEKWPACVKDRRVVLSAIQPEVVHESEIAQPVEIPVDKPRGRKPKVIAT